MKRIYFIRHAEAQSGGISDFERKLSPRGKEDAMKLGELLRSRRVAPHLIVSSSAVRALTTARIIAAALGVPQALRVSRELYDINLWALAEFIRTLDGASQKFFGVDECDLKANRYVLHGGVKLDGSVLHTRGADICASDACKDGGAGDDLADAHALNDSDKPASERDLSFNVWRKSKDGAARMGASGSKKYALSPKTADLRPQNSSSANEIAKNNMSSDAKNLSASGGASALACGPSDIAGGPIGDLGCGANSIAVASRPASPIGLNDAQYVFIVGHNPAIGGICELLGKRAIGKFPPCAICGLEFDVQSFAQIADHGGREVMFDYPR